MTNGFDGSFGSQQTRETFAAHNDLWHQLHYTDKTSEQVDAEMAAYFREKRIKAARYYLKQRALRG